MKVLQKNHKKSFIVKHGEFRYISDGEEALPLIHSAIRVIIIAAGPPGKSFIKKHYNGLDEFDNVELVISYTGDIATAQDFYKKNSKPLPKDIFDTQEELLNRLLEY